MRLATRCLMVLLLALGLTLPACGTGGGDSGTFFGVTPGPFTFGLPLPVLAGGASDLTLTNKANTDALVFLTGYKELGAAYAAHATTPTKLILPPLSTSVLALSGLLGEPASSGGFLYVDSRDADVLDAAGLPTPVPTSGYVYPTIDRRIGGVVPVADAYEGFAWRGSTVTNAVSSETTGVQLYNASVDFMAGGAVMKPVMFGLKEYDLGGTEVTDTTILVPASSTFTYVPTVTYGIVSATPLTGADLFQSGMRGVERDFFTSIEQRYKRNFDTQMPSLREIGFEVEWGDDFAGNTYDFGLLLSNPTDDDQTVVLTGIYRGNGAAPLLSTARFFVVSAHTTVFMATDNAQSFGLKLGENSFFDDLLGNVFASTTFESLTLAMQAPRELDVSVRSFDPAFSSFYMVLQGILRTTAAAALDLRIEPFLGTGNFDEVFLTNITTSEVVVPVGMTTPGGTRYTLDSVTVPPLSRILWSPDGLQLREDPTDLVGPFVTRGCFRFSPPTGLLFRARRREVNNVDTIILIRPQIIRDLQNDDDF